MAAISAPCTTSFPVHLRVHWYGIALYYGDTYILTMTCRKLTESSKERAAAGWSNASKPNVVGARVSDGTGGLLPVLGLLRSPSDD